MVVSTIAVSDVVSFNFYETRDKFTQPSPSYFVIQVPPHSLCFSNEHQLKEAVKKAANRSEPYTTIVLEGDLSADICEEALKLTMEENGLRGGIALLTADDKVIVSGLDDLVPGSTKAIRSLYNRTTSPDRVHETRTPEAADLNKAISEARAIAEDVVAWNFQKLCYSQGLDASKVVGSRRSLGTSDRLCSASLQEMLPLIPLAKSAIDERESILSWLAMFAEKGLSDEPYSIDEGDSSNDPYGMDDSSDIRLVKLQQVYGQAQRVLRHSFSLKATSICLAKGWAPLEVFGSEYDFAKLDSLCIVSLSHTLFRFSLIETAIMELKAYPVATAKRLLEHLEKHGLVRGGLRRVVDESALDDDEYDRLSILVAGGWSKSVVDYPLGKAANLFVSKLQARDGVRLQLADQALIEKQMSGMSGASDLDWARWIERQLGDFDAVVLLSKPRRSFDSSILKSQGMTVLEDFCYIASDSGLA